MLLRPLRIVGVFAVALLALAAFLVPARAARDAEPDPPQSRALTPTMKTALGLSAADYAYEMLSMRGALEGQLGDIHHALKAMAGAGAAPSVAITYVMALPGGRTVEVEISSFAELQTFIATIERRYAAFHAVLDRRLPHAIREGDYRVATTPACVDVWGGVGAVTIARDGPFFVVLMEDRGYMGMAVDGAVAVICPYGSILPLFGIRQQETITLSDLAGCTVTLDAG